MEKIWWKLKHIWNYNNVYLFWFSSFKFLPLDGMGFLGKYGSSNSVLSIRVSEENADLKHMIYDLYKG